MKILLETLEQRALFSAAVTPALLASHLASVNTGSAAVTAKVTSLTSHASTALTKLIADAAKLPKAKAALFAPVRADLTKLIASTTAHANALTKPTTTLATKAETTGITQLNAFTPAADATLAANSNSLVSLLVTPLTNLHLDLSGPLVTDLAILKSANPTATQLAADISALMTAYKADAAALTAGANTFHTNVSSLATTLTTESTMAPNILFTYTGTATNTIIHKTTAASLIVTSETLNGNWIGFTTNVNGAGINVKYAAVGTISNTGAFTATFAAGGSSEHLTGTLSGKTVSGSGIGEELLTFTVTHP